MDTTDLCEKYRPTKFCEILGNKSASQYLRNSCLTRRIANGIILHGDKGTGKNTLAHVYSKSLTCENFQGEPCGECKSCKSLEANYPDGSALSGVFLFDCTEIDEKRLNEIINKCLGFHSLNKIEKNIFIFDEFHRIRDRCQDKFLNPLIKSRHDLFIFCLIDLSQVESALQQRVIKFKTEPPTIEEIIPWLRRICDIEGITVKDEDALVYLVKEADRFPRECLKLLETFAVYGEPLTVNLVKRIFKHRRSIRNDD
jgi:DNA polymerase-3 subunit gamma/tau